MKTIPLIALLSLAAAVPAQAASTARFKVQIHATQAASWKKDITTNGCGGPGWFKGGGDSSLRLQSAVPQIVTARRVPGPEKVQLIGGALPISGNVMRQGDLSGGFLHPPPPGVCPQPEPVPFDCGSRNYPAGSQVNIQFDTPKSWNEEFYGTPPLAPSLHVEGPVLPGGHVGLGYQNCPGDRDDYLLGIHDPDGLAMESGAGGLSVRRIFGRQKRFTVTAHINRVSHRTVAPPNSGKDDVTVATGWRVQFTRLAH